MPMEQFSKLLRRNKPVLEHKYIKQWDLLHPTRSVRPSIGVSPVDYRHALPSRRLTVKHYSPSALNYHNKSKLPSITLDSGTFFSVR
jgi:hypothetical protein